MSAPAKPLWASFWSALILSAFWATVGWKFREARTDPVPGVLVEASPQQVQQIWRMCTVAANVVIYETEHMCRPHRECPDELLECEGNMYACWEATDEICDARIDSMFHEMFWEYRDPQFDEYETESETESTKADSLDR